MDSTFMLTFRTYLYSCAGGEVIGNMCVIGAKYCSSWGMGNGNPTPCLCSALIIHVSIHISVDPVSVFFCSSCCAIWFALADSKTTTEERKGRGLNALNQFLLRN